MTIKLNVENFEVNTSEKEILNGMICTCMVYTATRENWLPLVGCIFERVLKFTCSKRVLPIVRHLTV